jgi:hypothetical protein
MTQFELLRAEWPLVFEAAGKAAASYTQTHRGGG